MLMRSLTTLGSTAASTALVAPVVNRWLLRQRHFDVPNERSSHLVPTPRGGGLACAVGAAVGAPAAAAVGSAPSISWAIASVTLGAIGRVDDLVELSAAPRLGAQIVSGAIVGLRAGGAAGLALGALAVPAIVNAFNFMDGINGISGGTAAAWGLCVATDSAQANNVRVQGCLAAGMGIGFLPSNVPVASMFLGDVGSYLIGGGIAASFIESAFPRGHFCLLTAARSLAPLVPYLADTGTTILRRLYRGGALTQAHREHAYQRLVQVTGWEHWKVSSFASLAATGCGLAARRAGWSFVIAPLAVSYLSAPTWARALVVGGQGRE